MTNHSQPAGWQVARIPAAQPGSLLWFDGHLYDVAQNWRRLDGTDGGQTSWARYKGFDAALLSPNADLVAVVDSDGTKALLLEPLGTVVRELNRSWYCATAYRYPIALFTLADGRTAVAHCPDEFDRIEIEVAATGERLIQHTSREPSDIFHARLQVSPAGTKLLSAGWLWHPYGVACLFDLEAAITDPKSLDDGDRQDAFSEATSAEVAGACWLGDDFAITTSGTSFETSDGLGILTTARWSLAEERFIWTQPAPVDLGDLVSFEDGFLSANGHPRFFGGATGDLLAEWPDIHVPPTRGSMFEVGTPAGAGMIAVDPSAPRFAVAQEDHVVVIERTR